VWFGGPRQSLVRRNQSEAEQTNHDQAQACDSGGSLRLSETVLATPMPVQTA
jgi:hypothetical protein